MASFVPYEFDCPPKSATLTTQTGYFTTLDAVSPQDDTIRSLMRGSGAGGRLGGRAGSGGSDGGRAATLPQNRLSDRISFFSLAPLSLRGREGKLGRGEDGKGSATSVLQRLALCQRAF